MSIGDIGQPSHSAGKARRLLFCAAAVLIVLAGIAAWISRKDMNPDGVAYLSIAEQIRSSGLGAAVNGYWSPMYPTVLAVTLPILQACGLSEFAAVHMVNFVIFLLALASFTWLVSTVGRRSSPPSMARPYWILLAYTFFGLCTLHEITLSVVSPDLLLSAFIYAAAAASLTVSPAGLRWPVMLGAICGGAYLSKSVMFLIAPVFLVTSMPSRKRIAALGASVVAFAIVVTPFIVALSRAKHRPTFGDSGALNYAMFVDQYHFRAIYTHWTGEPAGSGLPQHAARLLAVKPELFEFASPFRVAYPPWYDPSYWAEGISPHFQLKAQIHAIHVTTADYYRLLLDTSWGMAVLLVLLFSRRGGGFSPSPASSVLKLLIPAVSALLIYGLVHVESRLVAPFLLLIVVAVLMTTSRVSIRTLRAAAITAAVLFSCVVVSDFAREVRNPPSSTDYAIADTLKGMGVRPDDAVSSVGSAIYFSWPRLLHVRVVAEVPDQSDFWSAPAPARAALLQQLRNLHAVVVVAWSASPPGYGWVSVPGTSVYISRLR
jgi:hypothetical protein